MDGRDFSVRLKKIKAEILAMKQAHEYGLNRTNFDSQLVEEPVSSAGVRVKITIKVDTRYNTEPFLQFNTINLDYAVKNSYNILLFYKKWQKEVKPWLYNSKKNV